MVEWLTIARPTSFIVHNWLYGLPVVEPEVQLAYRNSGSCQTLLKFESDVFQ